MQTGAVGAIVAGLIHSDENIQYHSEGAIWSIARKNAKRKEAFKAVGTLEKVQSLRKSPNENVRKGAEWVIEVLS